MLDNALVLIWMRNRRHADNVSSASPNAALVSNVYAYSAAISRPRPIKTKIGLTDFNSLAA